MTPEQTQLEEQAKSLNDRRIKWRAAHLKICKKSEVQAYALGDKGQRIQIVSGFEEHSHGGRMEDLVVSVSCKACGEHTLFLMRNA